MLLVVVAAGVAMAVTKQCNNNLPCEGTKNDDTLYERQGSKRDVIYGFKGEDVIDANTFNFDRDRRGRSGRELRKGSRQRRSGVYRDPGGHPGGGLPVVG